MAGLIRPDDCLPERYRGLEAIFEFVNWDGRHTRFNCGQAAACTFLTHHGKLEASADVMPSIEREFPPDNLGGWLGTSRRRVEQICRGFDLATEAIQGEAELRLSLADQRPAIVMLSTPGPKILRWRLPAGHWMVAYGFDDRHIYLSNWGRMEWDLFRERWQGFVPKLIQMDNRGLAATQD